MISEDLADCLRKTLEIHIAYENDDPVRAEEEIQPEIDEAEDILSEQEKGVLHMVGGDIHDVFKLLRGQKTMEELMQQSRYDRNAEGIAFYRSVFAANAKKNKQQ